MKTALVTGSARGIGRAICEEFARSGVAGRIVACDVRKEWCEETVAALRAVPGVEAEAVAMDVSSEESVVAGVAEAAKLFGSLDIVVNNAGITRDGLLARMTADQWDAVLGVNLRGAFLVSREAAKIMIRARSGSIVNIASVVGLMGNAGQANYSASKGGLVALTKTAARELGGRGIRVNAVAPGFINSKMTEVLPDAVKQQMLSIVPLKKFGEVSDVAKAVAFLASDAASYVTGQVLSVNGGMLMP
ncbi:MAG: 3-oxoacyl-[Kiritimatiellae bacterium]|nr:3-oxoacyl-[acyl-carrier-protein] reductase [Kiritimatiellia bacterium]